MLILISQPECPAWVWLYLVRPHGEVPWHLTNKQGLRNSRLGLTCDRTHPTVMGLWRTVRQISFLGENWRYSFFLISFFTFVTCFVYWGETLCRGQKTTVRSRFCVSTMWILGTEFRPSGLATNAVTHRPISRAWDSIYLYKASCPG